ncbi:MAG: hypothetical protein HXL04_00885 [Candidatus Nanosynbacter sp.]|nr:hypothetical protein [Candidatus Nanosynbacter sp.]
MITDQLLAKYPIISDQVDAKELGVLLRELEKVLQGGAVGNIVEFGCYVGTTSLFIRRLLDAYDLAGEFHVYDSFAGLPEKTPQDNSAAGAAQNIRSEFQKSRLATTNNSQRLVC